MPAALKGKWNRFNPSLLPTRQQSNRQHYMIKRYLLPTGLPYRTIVFCRSVYMVKWDAETGEVSTIKYNSGNEITKVWWNEAA
jgi:hypothetical protein